jgi:5-methylcytosine-specific restriction protein A
MPIKAMKFCSRCSRLAVKDGKCAMHAKQAEQGRDNKWLSMYHDPLWLRLRANQLAKEPLCFDCLKEHRLTPATVADHIQRHCGNPVLFYDPDNLQSMCASCHSKKTDREDAGFGNPGKHS